MTFQNSSLEYPPFAEWVWKRYDGHKKADLDEFIESNNENMFFIGTDSQNYIKRKKVCVFTTVLIAYKMGRGGAVLTHTDRVAAISSLRQRLLLEAMRSLETAWHLDGRLCDIEIQKINADKALNELEKLERIEAAKAQPSKNIIGIHLDVNSNLQYKSSKYKEELVGLVASQGFKAFYKPNAWAASSVADSKC